MKRILKGYLEKAGWNGVNLNEHLDEIEDTLFSERVILEEPGSHPTGYDEVRVLIDVTRSQKNRRKRQNKN